MWGQFSGFVVGSIGKTPLPTICLPFGTKTNKWCLWITTTCWRRVASLYFQYVRSHCKFSCHVINAFVQRVVLYLHSHVCTIYSSLLSLVAWLFVLLQIMIPMAPVWVQQKHSKVTIIWRIDHEWNGCTSHDLFNLTITIEWCKLQFQNEKSMYLKLFWCFPSINCRELLPLPQPVSRATVNYLQREMDLMVVQAEDNI